jgi:hypothetical protein
MSETLEAAVEDLRRRVAALEANEAVTGRAFTLRDKSGHLRASLNCGIPSGTYLTFFDDQEMPRLTLGADEQGYPTIDLIRDDVPVECATLAMFPGVGPGLLLRDREGKVALSLSIQSDGSPGIEICFPDSRHARVTLDILHGKPRFGLTDMNGVTRAALAIAPDDTISLALGDGRGRAIFQAP